MVADLVQLEKMAVQAYNVKLKKNVPLVAPVICCICDNPRAAEMVNHLGAQARNFVVSVW